MFIITNEYGQRVLMPNDLDTQRLMPVEDLERPEEERNYYEVVYIANCLTFEDCKRLYVEVERADKWEEIEEKETK